MILFWYKLNTTGMDGWMVLGRGEEGEGGGHRKIGRVGITGESNKIQDIIYAGIILCLLV